MEITITGVDATFNGTYTITGVPTTTTFTYAKTAADVTSTAVSPVGTGVTNVIHFIDYISGTDDPVFSICDDGTTAYWVTNDTVSGKLEVNKKALTSSLVLLLLYLQNFTLILQQTMFTQVSQHLVLLSILLDTMVFSPLFKSLH